MSICLNVRVYIYIYTYIYTDMYNYAIILVSASGFVKIFEVI